MRKQSGFTVIELLVVIVLCILAGVFFLQQKSQISQVDRDRERKTAINAFHYSLKEVYFKQKGSYPKSIDAKTLPSVDPDLFTDPDGKAIGTQGSDYRYDGLNCIGDDCRGYVVRADLEAEADFVRRSDD